MFFIGKCFSKIIFLNFYRSHLVPVFGFGQNNVFSRQPKISFLQSYQTGRSKWEKWTKVILKSIMLVPFARFGIMPDPQPITVVGEQFSSTLSCLMIKVTSIALREYMFSAVFFKFVWRKGKTFILIFTILFVLLFFSWISYPGGKDGQPKRRRDKWTAFQVCEETKGVIWQTPGCLSSNKGHWACNSVAQEEKGDRCDCVPLERIRARRIKFCIK